MARIITCIIENDGSVTADAAGYQGHGCAEVLTKLLSLIGSSPAIQHKPEYHQNVTTQTQIKAGR